MHQKEMTNHALAEVHHRAKARAYASAGFGAKARGHDARCRLARRGSADVHAVRHWGEGPV
jgi:hypothetical protein